MKKFFVRVKNNKIFFFLFIVAAILVSNFFIISPVSRGFGSVSSSTNVEENRSIFDISDLVSLILVVTVINSLFCLIIALNNVNKIISFKRFENEISCFCCEKVEISCRENIFFLRI